ncbi:hypothetical protein MMC13_006979 [Lambiella insularis]|nr:hypothetical protein [Lambiella insularis]
MANRSSKRPPKRNLVRWTEDMDIQLLLIIQKVCNQKNIKIPWDEIGEQLGGTITGGAIIQHLAKLRLRRIDAGLAVPEPLKRGGGLLPGETPATSSRGTSKRQGNGEKGASQNISNEDNEEEYDVDKASDPEASFGEQSNKKGKRKADSGDEGVDHGAGKKTSKKSKNKKGAGSRSFDAKQKGIKEEPNSPSIKMADNERITRRTNVDYAEFDSGESDNGEPDEGIDDDANEPHVAAGSSFLKLENFDEGNFDEDQGPDEYHEVAGQESMVHEARNMRGERRYAGGSMHNQGGKDKRNVTKLRLGQSERTLDFLKGLESSYSVTASPKYLSQTQALMPAPLAVNVGHRGSMGHNLNELTMGMPGIYNNNNSMMPPYSDGVQFGFGMQSPYGMATNFNNFIGSSGASYGQAMHHMMPPTPMTGQNFNGFPRDLYGNPVMGFPYPAQYSSGAGMPNMIDLHMSTAGNGFYGRPEHVAGSGVVNQSPLHNPVSVANTRKNSLSSASTTQVHSQGNNAVEANRQATEQQTSYAPSLDGDQPAADLNPEASGEFVSSFEDLVDTSDGFFGTFM